MVNRRFNVINARKILLADAQSESQQTYKLSQRLIPANIMAEVQVEYNFLSGNSGVKVSNLCLGTMLFADHSVSYRIMSINRLWNLKHNSILIRI